MCTYIARRAFWRCSAITTVNLPNVKIIRDSAFDENSSLQSVVLPKAEMIERCAFEGCQNLSNIEMPAVKFIEDGAFRQCTSLVSIDFPNLINGYLGGCSSLTSVNLPNAEQCGFSGCTALTSLSLPKVNSFVDYMFFDCVNLKYIDLPSVTSLLGGYKALYNVLNVTTLKLTANSDFKYNEYFFDNFYSDNCVLYLHIHKRQGGGQSPSATGKNEWMGKTWKEIKYVDNEGNVIEM